MTIGTFTMNTDPHQKCSSKMPPVIGPMPTPSAETPAQMPIALPRSRGSVKTFVMIESVAGMMNAAPIPINERVKMRVVAESAIAENSEPRPKMAKPMARKR